MNNTKKDNFISMVLRYLSRLLESIWLFFPGILFLLFTIFCFWSLGQGKDIIVAFIDNDSPSTFLGIHYTRLVFFVVIGFWVYVTWYSSRIIAYIKKKQEEKAVQDVTGINDETAEQMFNSNLPVYEISRPFLDEFPRMLGNACFLVLELAVVQLPVLTYTIKPGVIWLIFFGLLIILRFLNKWIDSTQSSKPSFRKTFWILLYSFIAFVIITAFINEISIYVLLLLLLVFHVVFIYYTNLRRIQMETKSNQVKTETKQEASRNGLEWLMDFFCIPRKEKGYYRWFIYIGAGGIIIYTVNILSLSFARGIGPFSTVVLAFAVLLAFGNVVTAISVRKKLSFHFILFILAFLIGGLHDTHFVRTADLGDQGNNYSKKPDLPTYLKRWLSDRNVLADSSANGYDIYFVMANGGASRSGYWTASVLGRLEDASVFHKPYSDSSKNDTTRFSDHVFCLSGTSGGGVGVATFFSLLRNRENRGLLYSKSAAAFLKQDYFTYTFARMLGPDFFNYIIPYSARSDRAAALESSFESSAREKIDSIYPVPFDDHFASFPALKKDGSINLPILCVNTTRMQDGNPGVVTNLFLDSGLFNDRIDVVRLLDSNRDITLASASILGARFPYLSPAGRIGNNYFVDGGYFDNSGAGVIQEMIRAIINTGRQDSIANGAGSALYRQVCKLHFKVLHITNSPVITDSNSITRVPPIKNDLLSPILTILGAYDMQTTVNDVRLINFLGDINTFSNNRAGYTQIPLYEDSTEWKGDPLNKRYDIEPSYAMNWFMSDTTLHRINNRLLSHQKLNILIDSIKAARNK